MRGLFNLPRAEEITYLKKMTIKKRLKGPNLFLVTGSGGKIKIILFLTR
jgi:hypothetical protein